ncbi:MAG: class I SAM-dependent methyltransferase [Bacteroidales bacterium]|nr:class I SAM-dependent methyltransferase [Bacteroidales bacterium]
MKKHQHYIPILENPDEYTIAKPKHLIDFVNKGYDLELFGYKIDLKDSRLKIYQDLLVYVFINQYLKPGSKILEIGGGNSRILPKISDTYECWNIDKFEGAGNGPDHIPDDQKEVHIIEDFIGNSNDELPENYFDFVFSISALEHVPDDNDILHNQIINELQFVLKDGGYSLHCLDIVKKDSQFWIHNLIISFFQKLKTLNVFIPGEKIFNDDSILYMSEDAYNIHWKKFTKTEYALFGKPSSYQIFWKK